MKAKKQLFPVDEAKLGKELRQRGMKMADFSRNIGLCDSYLSHAINRDGGINTQIVKLLKSELGIDYESIKPQEKAAQVETFKQQFPEREKLVKHILSFDYLPEITDSEKRQHWMLALAIYDGMKAYFKDSENGGDNG